MATHPGPLRPLRPGQARATFRGDPGTPVQAVALAVPAKEADSWRFATPPAILEALGLMADPGQPALGPTAGPSAWT